MEESRPPSKDSSSTKSPKARSPATTGTRVSSTSSTSQPLESAANVGRNSSRGFPTTPPKTSIYEPTLRFPTPFGNHDLAEWISSSDPDIKSKNDNQDKMRVNEDLNINSVAVDGAGLSESTYELISGNTDNESQDGTYAESLMTGSMDSLDMMSRDDAASDHIVDEEEEEEEEEYADESTTIDTAEQASLAADEADDDDETMLNEEATESAATLRPLTNFAQQSLRTPSLGTPVATPEVSKIFGQDETSEMPRFSGLELWFHKLFQAYDEVQHRVDQFFDRQRQRVAACKEEDYASWYQEELKRQASRQLAMIDAARQPERHRLVKRVSASAKYWVFIFIGLLPGLLLSTVWLFPIWAKKTPAPLQSSTTTTPTDITSTANSIDTITTSNVKALAPPQQDHGEMWFNKIMNPPPVVRFSSESDDSVVVEVKPTIPKYWLGEDCVGVDSARDGDMVANQWEVTKHDTITVKFLPQEAHGLIEVKLKADCRPKFERAVKVRFSKRGLLEKTFDRASNLTKEMKSLFVRAQEEAKHNLCSMQSSWRTLGMLPAQMRDHTRARATEELSHWRQVFAQSFDSVSGVVVKMKELSNSIAWQNVRNEMVKDLPLERAQMALLDYQIPAKIWWLRLTAGSEVAEEYKSKAKAYTAKKETDFLKTK